MSKSPKLSLLCGVILLVVSCILNLGVILGLEWLCSRPTIGTEEFEPHWRVLALWQNNLKASELTKLERLPNLEEVYLDNVRFDDPVLAMQMVGKVKTLKRLTLTNTNITDESLAGLTRLENLQILELHDTDIGDTGVAHLAALPKLTHLDIGSTKVSDKGIDSILQLELENLTICYAAVTDDGLQRLTAMKSLRRLHAWGREITQSGIWRFEEKRPDCQIR